MSTSKIDAGYPGIRLANMPTSCTQANECICYLDRLRAILLKFSVTATPLHYSPPSLWTNVEQWSYQTERLVNAIREKDALRGVCSDFDSSSIVFQVLTLGFRETINCLEASLKETAKTPNQRLTEELSERVVLHLAATDMMSLYLERGRSRHMPNARMEIKKWDDIWIEQRARLEARLKTAFGCSSFDLTFEGSIAGDDKSVDPLNHRGNLLEATRSAKHPLLTILHLEMGEIASGASHDACPDVLMRIAIYSIAKLRESLENPHPEDMDNTKTTRWSVAIHKVAWVVHLLANCSQSKTSDVGFRHVVRLILEKLTQLFDSYSKDHFSSTVSELLDYGEFTIKDPLRRPGASAQDQEALYDQYPPMIYPMLSQSSSQSPDSINISPATEDMATLSHGIHVSDQTHPGEKETKIGHSLLRAVEIATGRIIEEQYWVSTRVRTSQEPGFEGKLRIRSSREHLSVDTVVDPAVDEMVPGYAYQSNPRAFWFRKADRDVGFYFSVASGELINLVNFQSLFMNEHLTHFPLIESITLVQSKGSQEMKYDRPTAQMWIARSEPTEVNPEPITKCFQTPVSKHNTSSGHPPKFTLSTDKNASKVLLFCGTSVFAIIVSDQLRSTEESDTIILHSNAEKGGSIHLYELQGGRENFAGLRMNRHALEPGSQSAPCKRAYARVQMTFPNAEAREEFSKTLRLCLEQWFRTMSRVREMQRSPIIEPKSIFCFS
ncbi:hypothetical protein JMJ35_003978 [Cladonia borealis]|uniref:Uncharacterized protein n=1 Tax=Cladonia borealis TaxID=184061 RepID=A0AA39V663_9LECA|nr:hypothetical protein JMJ35_003978 [Cladonia borealis]